MINDALEIPVSVTTPCIENPAIFNAEALDPDPNEWTTLKPHEQKVIADAKRLAEDVAVAACLRCPILDQCKEWATNPEIDVFGVAGGMRHSERYSPDFIDSFNERGTKPLKEELINLWLKKNIPMEKIATSLGITLYQVRKVNQLNGMDENARSRHNIETANGRRWDRLSPRSIMLYDALVEHGTLTKEDAIALIVPLLGRQESLSAAQKGRKFRSHDAKARAGARRIANSYIRVGVRTGTILEEISEDSGSTLKLNPEIEMDWISYRSIS